MIRRALAALCLLCSLASVADAAVAKYAVFYSFVGSSGKAERSTGQRGTTGTGWVSATNSINNIIMDRTGTRYVIFDLADSAGGWAHVMGSTRPAGMADSTWFRTNGFTGQIFAFQSITLNAAPIRFFTDGAAQRGTFAASPLSGTWSTPTLAFVAGAVDKSDSSYVNGIESAQVPSDASAWTRFAFHDNGDSVSFFSMNTGVLNPFAYNLEPSEAASVTRLVDIDSIVPGAGLGNAVAAWKYKNVYYVGSSHGSSPMWSIYGLSLLFRATSYTPPRKLNVHWSLDHVYPSTANARSAVSDSFFAYVRAMDLKFSGMYTGGSGATATGNGTGQNNSNMVNFISQWDAYKDRLYGMPHSHRTGVGMTVSTVASTWDVTAFTDTATWRGYFNMVERAVSDTMKVAPARGYYKTIGMPQNLIYYPDLYVLCQNGYTDLRVSSNDSCGFVGLSYARGRRVTSGPLYVNGGGVTSVWGDHIPAPWWYGDPSDATGRRGIHIHEEFTPLVDSDTTWNQVAAVGGANDINSKMAAWMGGWARAAVWDGDFYFHPSGNLIGAANGNAPIQVFMRRTLYFYNRASNLVSQDPVYSPRMPARR